MAYIQDWGMRVQAQPQINTTRRAFLHLSQNENGRMLNIRITDVNIPSGSTAVLAGTKPDGTVYSQAGTLSGNTATFAEDVQMTAVVGTWDAKITVTNGGNCICTARIAITIDPDTVAGGAVPSDSQLDGIIAECRAIADSVRKEAYGSPLVADAVEDMTDQSRVYVYIGSESGMTAGHWYYYNGSAWTDGGVYNAVAVDTDTTLTISGKAADAKEVGDQITDLKEDFTNLAPAIIETVSGAVASFTDGADGLPMKSVKVNIAPLQSGSGDPSPSNVRAISGWDSVKATRAGKNLCNILDSAGVYSGITYTASNGVITVDGTATENVYRGAVNILLKAGTYTVTNIGGTDTADAYVLVSDTFTNPSSWITLANLSNGSPITFTLDHDIVAAVRVVVRNGKTVSNKVFKPILVYGSDAPTEFEPYNGNTYNISLSSAGTVYGGTLDAVNGELVVDRAQIASYNGEVLPSTWISDRDVYASGTTPTIGAQVVYTLATPLTYQLSATEIKSLLGINNVWSDAGPLEVEYRADTKLYIDKRLAEVTA